MDLNGFLKKTAQKIISCQKWEIDIPLSVHEKVLNSQPEPTNDRERAYAQYICQKKIFGRLTSFCTFGAACLFMPPKLFLTAPSMEKEKTDAVFVSENIPLNVIPTELKEELESIVPVNRYDMERFDREDRRFFFRLWKEHPFSLSFLFKCLIKIRFYSALLEKYDPKVIITCNEFSYTSSVLTLYCEEKGIEHIDVMHGEKIFNARDSFFRFHRTYVWDDNYRRLFLRLRAEESQFRVAVPPSLLFDKKAGEKTVDFTYYLQNQKGGELKSIVEMMLRLAEKGNKVAFRPHPRYTPMDELSELLKESRIEVENYREITIEDSILRTRNVISVFSTVLQQAFYNGVDIVIDDLSDPKIMKTLEERDFVMLNHPHIKMSKLLEEKL